jgi:hypothetical protein
MPKKRRLKGDGQLKEVNPRPKQFRGIQYITERIGSGTIRRVVGYSKTLNAFDSQTILADYIIALASALDDDTAIELIRQARSHLPQREYDSLLLYQSLLFTSRMGIPAGVR